MPLNRVLDLTNKTVLNTLSIQPADLVRKDYQITNEIGEAAYEQGFQAILAGSATGVAEVLAVFPENLGESIFETDLIDIWRSPSDLGPLIST